jgi:endonuclease/exonuclease/phosphatase family metal-dependent hydrolase
VLVARLTRQGAPPLTVLATHLESAGAPALRRAQLEATALVARRERAQGRQVLLLGDLNMGPAEAAEVLAGAGMVHAVGEAIDQVWIDATLTATAPEERPVDGASDHPSVPTVTVR